MHSKAMATFCFILILVNSCQIIKKILDLRIESCKSVSKYNLVAPLYHSLIAQVSITHTKYSVVKWLCCAHFLSLYSFFKKVRSRGSFRTPIYSNSKLQFLVKCEILFYCFFKCILFSFTAIIGSTIVLLINKIVKYS